MKSVSNHEDSVLEMLRTDENVALEYLVAALEEIDEEGGESVFLTAVRRVVEARGGFAAVSNATGLNRGNLPPIFSRWEPRPFYATEGAVCCGARFVEGGRSQSG